MTQGTEEGEQCNRDGCDGTMALTQDPCCCSAISNPDDDEPLTALDKLKEYGNENTQ